MGRWDITANKQNAKVIFDGFNDYDTIHSVGYG